MELDWKWDRVGTVLSSAHTNAVVCAATVREEESEHGLKGDA